MKNILITGVAGFIGFHLAKRLINLGYNVSGIDNLNNYYNPKLKITRLEILKSLSNFSFYKIDVSKKVEVEDYIKINKFEILIHLAAEPGVRSSQTNQYTYFDTNIIGFFNVLNAAKNNHIKKIIFASSSSVYGDNPSIFEETLRIDKPSSFYGASKSIDEILASSFALDFDVNIIALRLFSVYGPWGRPDMAIFQFTDAILKGLPITLFNGGEMYRSFTYVDDVTEGIAAVIDKIYNVDTLKGIDEKSRFKAYNLGSPVLHKVSDMLIHLQTLLQRDAKINLCGNTYNEPLRNEGKMELFMQEYNFVCKSSLQDGLNRFVSWYLKYYNASELPKPL